MFSKIQMSICDKIREAREWGKCVDTLKASVDSMYEICHKQQNIMGCEEAIMFLKHAIRDFHCLIDTIKIEQNWESSEERPMTSVAWEIRGTVSRNSLLQKKEKECQTQNVPTAAATSSSAATATVLPTKPKEEEWQLVQRRKSTSSRQTLLENWTGVPFARPPIGLVVKAPKSAMDLPQTKSSMAKMAYSRQLLFEKSRQVFMEKLNSNKRSRKQPTNSGAHNQNELSKQAAPAAMGGGTKADNSAAQQNPMAMEGIEQRVVAVIRQNSEPPPDCLKMLIDKLSDDCEWRAMTEEEQSLAQEEASLKKEIEEEENLSPFEDDDEDFIDDGIADIVMDQAESSSGGVLARMPPPVEKPEEKQQQQQTTATTANGGDAGGEKEKEATTNVNVIHFWNPGEIAQLRAKLLSPTKRRRIEEMDSENKLKRAEELRNALQQERAQRLQLLHQRVEEVRNKREQIQQRKLAHLETVKERIQRAGENRTKGLEEIIQRAKEDELKIMEITLLNNFGAANQKLEKRYTQIRARNRYLRLLQKAEEERQRRIEENKQQKEAAERRRNDAEKLRTKRLQEQALDQQQRQCHALKHRVKALEKYKARVAQHSQRVCQRKARELEEKQQLLDRIQQKHEKRTENYEQCKEQVRRRAMELSSPRPCHLWAQSLADFSHPPSDLCLLSLQQQFHHQHSPQHQQPRPHSSLQDQEQQHTTMATATATKSCGALKSAVDQQQQQSLTCFRCKTKIHSDLQLLSHLLSEEHLRAAGIDTQRQTLVQNADLDYDFLRNEFSRVIGAGTEEKECGISSSAAGSSQTSSFTAELPQQQQPETALALATTPMMTDSQCSSAAESTREPMAMAQLVAKVAELFFMGDAQMGNLLSLLLPKAEEQQQQNGNGQSAAAKKKKRAKLRQKIQKEFESLGFVSSAFHQAKGTQPNFGGIANLPRDLKKSLNEAATTSKQLCSKNGQQIPCQDLLPVERALAELAKCVQQQNKKNGISNNSGEVKDSLLRAMQETNLVGQLLELCVRIEQQRKEMGGGGTEHCNNKLSTTNATIMNRFIHKVLRLLVLIAADDNADGNIVVGKLLNGKSLLAICEFFQLNAQKLIIVPPTAECQQQQQFDADHPMSTALSILSILTRLVAADGSNDTKVPDLLLAHLCTLGCLPHFLAHCGGRLESAELCAASRMEKGEREELLFPSGSGVSSSICQVLTDFVAATFLALQSQQQQHKGAAAAGIEEEAPSRRDSASCCGQSDNGSSVRTTTTETLVSSSSGTHNQPMTNIGGAGGGGQQQKSSAERMRSAGLLWLYLLTVHAYQQFGRFPVENPSPAGSPPMPSPSKEEKATLHTLANCFLRLFNAFAGSKLISAFLELEREQMLATRLTCILRSILHMLTTTMNGKEATTTAAAKGVKEHGEEDGQQLTMMLMRECLVAIGHFASISPRHQLLCVFGWHRSILASLCQLPLEFVLNAPRKHLLLPTLCAILRQNRLGIDCIRGEFCLHYLIDYIKAAIHSRAEPASAAMASSSSADFQLLSALIPPDQWEDSRQFFQTNTAD